MAFLVKVNAWALAEGLADDSGQVGMRIAILCCSRPRCTFLRAEAGRVGLGRAEAVEGDMVVGEGGM